MNSQVKTDEKFSTGVRKDGFTVTVDLNKCIAVGPCAIAAPGVFKIRPEDGKAIISNPDGEDLEQILEAARCCPILAISIKNQLGKEIYP
jgi:ferredoxin